MIDWRHWHNEPFLMGGLVFFGWLWAILAGPLRARLAPGEPFPRRQAWFFYSSLVLFYLAVGSPLDQIGERFLFSVHMLQHLILVHPVAILFLLGLPHWMIDVFLRPLSSLKPVRFFFHPFVCAFTYSLVTSLWHMPYLYDWALQDKTVHVIEHLMFFGAALFYWWSMLSPSRALPRASYAAQMLFFFFMLLLMMPIYAYITFSDNILYATYEYAPRLFPDFSPADDQLLAGVGMQLISLSVAMFAFGLAFFHWFQAGERKKAGQAGRVSA
ncbi:MAG: cytochrome c oxidase assembly protein [Verrucomicrobia bacterium]|nr:cytochrome c oxidase assembly protein [Verrucomicrobiota bacterium]